MSILNQIAIGRGITEKQLLIDELERAGSIERAATSLGVFPNSIRVALRKHRLEIKRVTKLRVIELDAPPVEKNHA